MPDHKDIYYEHFAKVATVIEMLIDAQQEAEERCISDENQPEIRLHSRNTDTVRQDSPDDG